MSNQNRRNPSPAHHNGLRSKLPQVDFPFQSTAVTTHQEATTQGHHYNSSTSTTASSNFDALTTTSTPLTTPSHSSSPSPSLVSPRTQPRTLDSTSATESPPTNSANDAGTEQPQPRSLLATLFGSSSASSFASTPSTSMVRAIATSNEPISPATSSNAYDPRFRTFRSSGQY